MCEKVCKRVEIWVYVLCVSGNAINLIFKYEGKPHLNAKIDYVPLNVMWAFRSIDFKSWSDFVFYKTRYANAYGTTNSTKLVPCFYYGPHTKKFVSNPT